MAEYKLLDPNRKAVLRLPHLAFKLWHAYWMFESDDQEAYPSLEVLEEATGMDRKTIIKWRNYLVKHGWLRVCGGTAAERYSKATQGAHKVLIYRVDDPTKNASSGEFPLPNQLSSGRIPPPSSGASQGVEKLHQEHSGKFPPKVSASVSASASSSSMSQAMISLSAYGGCDAKADKVFDLKDEKQEQQQEQLQQQKQRPRRLRLVKKYDEPFPVGFNDDPSEAGVKFRAEWCEAHRLDRPKKPAPAPANPEPLEMSEPAAPSASAPPTPPPARGGNSSVKAKFNCPVCDYTHKYGSEVADHIEGEHPELGRQWVEILCPEEECRWSVEWNLVSNDKESQEARLAEHLDIQHNPRSHRYDPWGECGCRDFHQLSRCPNGGKTHYRV